MINFLTSCKARDIQGKEKVGLKSHISRFKFLLYFLVAMTLDKFIYPSRRENIL
jgi:hypothetical protein